MVEQFADVDAYLRASTMWPDEIQLLRPILRRAKLAETIKWGKPCYVHDGKNIAVLQEMKHFLALMFFNGVHLDDPEGILESQGPNSRTARRICFRSTSDVKRFSKSVGGLVAQAIALEESGVPALAPAELVLVPELAARLRGDTALSRAFASLTPGRQREYNLHFADAKKSETRLARIDKYVPRILSGRGLRDR